MALYEYQCLSGAHRFERIQRYTDPLPECPVCGSPVRKLVSSPAIQFKGSGFYITDYAKKSAGESGEGGSKPEGGKAEGGTSEGSSGDGAKAEASKSDGSKSDGAKSDSSKSEGSKSESASGKSESGTSSPAATAKPESKPDAKKA